MNNLYTLIHGGTGDTLGTVTIDGDVAAVRDYLHHNIPAGVAAAFGDSAPTVDASGKWTGWYEVRKDGRVFCRPVGVKPIGVNAANPAAPTAARQQRAAAAPAAAQRVQFTTLAQYDAYMGQQSLRLAQGALGMGIKLDAAVLLDAAHKQHAKLLTRASKAQAAALLAAAALQAALDALSDAVNEANTPPALPPAPITPTVAPPPAAPDMARAAAANAKRRAAAAAS